MAKRFDENQIEALKMAFRESKRLTKEKKLELVRITGLDMEQVSSWFSRKRMSERSRESNEELQKINRAFERSLHEQQARLEDLEKELRENERKQLELEEENRYLKMRLAIVEVDSHDFALMPLDHA